MSWFRKRSPQPPPSRPPTTVGYNYIMDALDAECIAMDLDGGQRFAVAARVIEALEPSEVAYDLRRIEGAILAGCAGAGLSPTNTANLTRGVMNRLSCAPIMVPRGTVLLALTEESVALKIDAVLMGVLAYGVVKQLAGEAAAQEMLDGVKERMAAMEEGREANPMPATPETMHELEKEVIGAVLGECAIVGIDPVTTFDLGKRITYRLGGKEAMARYADKVTALVETTQALQKLDRACR